MAWKTSLGSRDGSVRMEVLVPSWRRVLQTTGMRGGRPRGQKDTIQNFQSCSVRLFTYASNSRAWLKRLVVMETPVPGSCS
ncbi:hypothetical protein CRUP_006904 [Coryphaenoides rupestris]|nr:hypothetical protein CRUP_006904 [Coryphaenoides rupestris]